MEGRHWHFLLGVCFAIAASEAIVAALDQRLVLETIRNGVEADLCPPNSPCKANYTCCRVSSTYGCCDFYNATCCVDQKHCCPHGYKCDLEHHTCLPESSANAESPMKSLEAAGEDVTDIICPDGTSSCPDDTTCCEISQDTYGCCPIPNAVCCSDKLHCCPHGYTCDVAQGTCTQKDQTIMAMEKFAAKKSSDVLCPGGQSTCPDDTTCCEVFPGSYGCCPVPNAVCCSDKVHCCPHGYTCDVAQGTCTQKDQTITAMEKFAAKKLSDVVCPGGQSTCPDSTTCCETSSGTYACCPLPNAVCCSDKVHCCPHGYTCNVAQGTCVRQGKVMVALTKLPSEKINDVICPGGKAHCPDGTTCCQVSHQVFGCCPITHAVCCSDGLHCCPQGYTCDVAQQTCTKETEIMKALVKLPARKSNLGDVMCPDGISRCADGSTCCKVATGQYGCCPYQTAVCCSDMKHCCPNGYTCNIKQGTCTQGDITMEASSTAAAISVNDITCPDGSSMCPDDATCCKLPSGQYGCCPYKKAVCCIDHEHCCPDGYTCDVVHSKCKKVEQVEALAKIAVLARSVGVITCPDGKSACPDETTCCMLPTGVYSCCPMPKATCCSDHEHCCPDGYTCDVADLTCEKKGEVIKALTKFPATNLEDITCQDGTTCLSQQTCCKLASGKYGCCPLPKAVCCSDRIHCCPEGYTCAVTEGSCIKKGEKIKAMLKLPAKNVNLNTVTCSDGKSTCPDGSTCCLVATGLYNCCPMAKAVCCSDKLHCCPNGYTCDVAHQTCNKKGEVIKALTNIPAKRGSMAEDRLVPAPKSPSEMIRKLFWGKTRDNCVMCPDDSECPDFNTCCQLESGQYGCCAFPSAVCCSDHTHCCRHGYQCDAERHICYQQGAPDIPMLGMSAAQKSLAKKSVASKFDEI